MFAAHHPGAVAGGKNEIEVPQLRSLSRVLHRKGTSPHMTTIEDAEIANLIAVCRETGRIIEDTEALISEYRRRVAKSASCSSVERGTSRAADPRFIEASYI